MTTSKKTTLSQKRIKRLKVQGYCGISDSGLSELAFGNRFAYILCAIVVFFGVAMANVPLLSFMTVVAFFGIVLPNHPFDYIYNLFVRKLIRKPKLPPRSKQVKFACLIATLWLVLTMVLFFFKYRIGGYVLGGILFVLAFTVSVTDICIPSMCYNYLKKIRV